jgi:hypothetical protein
MLGFPGGHTSTGAALSGRVAAAHKRNFGIFFSSPDFNLHCLQG